MSVNQIDNSSSFLWFSSSTACLSDWFLAFLRHLRGVLSSDKLEYFVTEHVPKPPLLPKPNICQIFSEILEIWNNLDSRWGEREGVWEGGGAIRIFSWCLDDCFSSVSEQLQNYSSTVTDYFSQHQWWIEWNIFDHTKAQKIIYIRKLHE